ncbi:hypothetical protein M885DRAFT_527111 [Pelagophyceae sp. CCMP2097]|nr:hypothetical protein M885DRAFT_527111 [Pelagophyceae sp. CCMP2097]
MRVRLVVDGAPVAGGPLPLPARFCGRGAAPKGPPGAAPRRPDAGRAQHAPAPAPPGSLAAMMLPGAYGAVPRVAAPRFEAALRVEGLARGGGGRAPPCAPVAVRAGAPLAEMIAKRQQAESAPWLARRPPTAALSPDDVQCVPAKGKPAKGLAKGKPVKAKKPKYKFAAEYDDDAVAGSALELRHGEVEHLLRFFTCQLRWQFGVVVKPNGGFRDFDEEVERAFPSDLKRGGDEARPGDGGGAPSGQASSDQSSSGQSSSGQASNDQASRDQAPRGQAPNGQAPRGASDGPGADAEPSQNGSSAAARAPCDFGTAELLMRKFLATVARGERWVPWRTRGARIRKISGSIGGAGVDGDANCVSMQTESYTEAPSMPARPAGRARAASIVQGHQISSNTMKIPFNIIEYHENTIEYLAIYRHTALGEQELFLLQRIRASPALHDRAKFVLAFCFSASRFVPCVGQATPCMENPNRASGKRSGLASCCRTLSRLRLRKWHCSFRSPFQSLLRRRACSGAR